MYIKIKQRDTIFRKTGKRKGRLLMKKSTHVHSSLIQNRQFRARIAHKECGYFNEVGRKCDFEITMLKVLIAEYRKMKIQNNWLTS